jgi:steroid delta-isomerase-like uncharacterized protein
MPRAKELLEQWVSTFTESRWDEGEALWTADGMTEEIGTGRTTDVRQGTENAKSWKAAFPDARGRIENVVEVGNQAAGEVVWMGTNSGPLNGRPPTGKGVTVRAAVFVLEEGGKLKRVRHYLDVAGMMAQLG